MNMYDRNFFRRYYSKSFKNDTSHFLVDSISSKIENNNGQFSFLKNKKKRKKKRKRKKFLSEKFFSYLSGQRRTLQSFLCWNS